MSDASKQYEELQGEIAEQAARIGKLESTLQGLKLAATALGITGVVLLGFVTYVYNRASSASEAAAEASSVASEALEVAGKAREDLEEAKDRAIAEIEERVNKMAEVAVSAKAAEELEGLVARSWLVEADRLYSDDPWREIVRLKTEDGHAKALRQGWKKVGGTLMVVVPPDR